MNPAKMVEEQEPRILILSSSFYTDRMILYSDFYRKLSSQVSVEMWLTSQSNPDFALPAEIHESVVRDLPVYRSRELYSYLRRIIDSAWDFRHQPPSRISAIKHVWQKHWKLSHRTFNFLGKLVGRLKVEAFLADRLESLLINRQHSSHILSRLKESRPDLILATGLFRPDEQPIIAAARKLGIPVVGLINSWDNISTKERLSFKLDGYLVWSEQMKEHLHSFYPYSRQVPVHKIGAPQFDVFFERRFHLSREEFFESLGLRAELPVIVYAIGSPNFLQEIHGAIFMAEMVAKGELGDVQLIVRLHPQFDFAKEVVLFEKFGSRVRVQYKDDKGKALNRRFQSENEIREWVNTIRHADVVVNLSSTIAVEAALLDRPVVNLDYDPQPGQPNQELIKDINHVWTHFKPIALSGGLWLVNDRQELLAAVKAYLRNPALHSEDRRKIAEYVCGYLDGRSGERMADAVVDLTRECKRSPVPISDPPVDVVGGKPRLAPAGQRGSEAGV
jgi:hypothetical protein